MRYPDHFQSNDCHFRYKHFQFQICKAEDESATFRRNILMTTILHVPFSEADRAGSLLVLSQHDSTVHTGHAFRHTSTNHLPNSRDRDSPHRENDIGKRKQQQQGNTGGDLKLLHGGNMGGYTFGKRERPTCTRTLPRKAYFSLLVRRPNLGLLSNKRSTIATHIFLNDNRLTNHYDESPCAYLCSCLSSCVLNKLLLCIATTGRNGTGMDGTVGEVAWYSRAGTRTGGSTQ